jgi:putative flippase GtrA
VGRNDGSGGHGVTISRTFASFVVCGGIAACVNLGTRWCFSLFLPYPVAITLAYMMGMLSGFLLFKLVVFRSRGPETKVLRESWRFVVVNALALLQTLAVSIFLAEWFFPAIGFTFHGHDIAHVIGVAVPVISSYFFHKNYTFQKIKK